MNFYLLLLKLREFYIIVYETTYPLRNPLIRQTACFACLLQSQQKLFVSIFYFNILIPKFLLISRIYYQDADYSAKLFAMSGEESERMRSLRKGYGTSRHMNNN